MEVLEKTMEIWIKLRDNPHWWKEHPDMKHLTDKYAHGCPCCSYIIGEAKVHSDYMPMNTKICKDVCPMWEIWGNVFCEEPGSPYHKWMNTISECVKESNAGKIVLGAERMIKKLNKK